MKLKSLRSSKGVTQQEVADSIGIDRALYVRYENGTRKPPLHNLAKLADYFGVSSDFLLGRVENPEDTKGRTFSITPLEAFRIYARDKLGHDPSKEELRDIDLAADIAIKRIESERK